MPCCADNTEYLLDQLPEQSSIVVLATHSIWLEQNAEVLSGSVVVNESGDSPFLDSEVALSVGIGVSVAAGCDIKANSIKVKQNATVAGNVYYKIGLSNTVFANFHVPNGTLWLRQGSVVEGAFIARDVDVGIGVKVSLKSAW